MCVEFAVLLLQLQIGIETNYEEKKKLKKDHFFDIRFLTETQNLRNHI